MDILYFIFNMEEKINKIELKLEDLDEKIERLTSLIQNHVVADCNKMSEHINFVETIYDNVKNPLGFLCSKINFYVGNDDRYSLT